MRVSKFSDMIPAVMTLAVFTGALVLFPGKGHLSIRCRPTSCSRCANAWRC